MIVDSCVHIKGGDYFRREFDPDATVRMLAKAGINRASVFSLCVPSRFSMPCCRGNARRPAAHPRPRRETARHP
jgi:hypothetical protein